MCLICVDFQKQKLTLPEAWRAYGEMARTLEPKHAKEVKEMLEEAEEEQNAPDEDEPNAPSFQHSPFTHTDE